MFLRRDRRGPGRYIRLRVGLLFAAAGTWLAGVLSGRASVTGAAILLLVVALLIGVVERRREG